MSHVVVLDVIIKLMIKHLNSILNVNMTKYIVYVTQWTPNLLWKIMKLVCYHYSLADAQFSIFFILTIIVF